MKPIRNDQSHHDALARVDALLAINPPVQPGSRHGDELDVLVDLIEGYEVKRFPIDLPSPLAAIQFRMEQAGLKQRDLIPFIGSRAKVAQVLSGKRPLTLPMARALHRNLGIPAELLLADEQMSDEHREWERYPIKEMRKRGWVTTTLKNAKDVMGWLMEKAGTQDPLPIFRKNDHNRRNAKTNPYALEAWCLAVLAKSFEIVAKPSRAKAAARISRKTLESVADLSVFEDGPKKAQEYLQQHGVALVVLPHLPQTHLDGASLRRADGVSVIGMTLRYDRLDHFWFCLLHELAHVLLHIQQNKDEFFIDDMSIAGLDGREAEADQCANDVLLPEATWAASAAAQDPTILNVGSLAAAVNRSPAIVAGRIRFNTRNYRLLTHLVGTGQVRRRFPEAFPEVA